MLLFVYVCAEYFTNGEILGSLNIFLFQYDGITWWDVFDHVLKCILFSVVLYVAGVTLIKNHRKIHQLFFKIK